jgi:hypothetical protein
MKSNISRHLRVGYGFHSNQPKFHSGVEVFLAGFDIEFVPIVNYTPYNKGADGKWLGALGALNSQAVYCLLANMQFVFLNIK